MSSPEPVRFGQYTVTRILGRGALGRVYHGEDPLSARQVAVRVIQARVERQLKAATRLSHPGIIAIYDVGEVGRYSFAAMEYAPGGSLEEQLEAGVEFSPTQATDLAKQVGAALDYAHGHGVIHQDVRPSNILIADDGRYKVTDFRNPDVDDAVLSDGDDDRRRPFCLSPEQVRGRPLTASADQFSLAVVVYRLLTGRRPFDAETAEAIALQISSIEPPSPAEVNPRLSTRLSQVVMRALSKESYQRYPSCGAFADAMAAAIARPDTVRPAVEEAAHGDESWDHAVLGSPVSPLPVDVPAPAAFGTGDLLAAPKRRRSRFTLVVVGAVAVVVAAWLVWTLDLLGPPRIETTLAVESNPPDQALAIWVNDVPAGLTTPADILLEGEEGENVRLDLVRDDEIVASTSLLLAPEMTPEWIPDVEVPLRPVRYEVRSEPTGARVRLDGQAIARPTPVDVDLFPGQDYEIEVELDGYQTRSRTVDPADLDPELSALDFSLARIILPGRVRAQAVFPVTLLARSNDGGEHRTEGRSPSLELQPGTYSVSVTAPEVFFTAETDVTIREGEEVELPEIPRAVKVLVFDVPGNAAVRIDDFDPFPSGGPRTVTVGGHRFVFEWPSGERLSRDVQIERDGQEVSARHP